MKASSYKLVVAICSQLIRVRPGFWNRRWPQQGRKLVCNVKASQSLADVKKTGPAVVVYHTERGPVLNLLTA